MLLPVLSNSLLESMSNSLRSYYPESVVLLFNAYTKNNNGIEVGTSITRSYITVQKDADGEPMYDSSGGFAPAVIEGKGLRNDVAYSTLFATLATETITLTAQDYCLQVFDSGSATCSYGTATVDNPLIFTATAGGTTFTPTGITNWMLTEGPYVHDQLQVGDSQSSTAGVHKIDMEEYKDVPDYVQLSGVI